MYRACTRLQLASLLDGFDCSIMMTINPASVDQEATSQVLHLLAMRHQIQPREGLGLINGWLQANPEESALSLKRFCKVRRCWF